MIITKGKMQIFIHLTCIYSIAPDGVRGSIGPSIALTVMTLFSIQTGNQVGYMKEGIQT